jgi:hypothetical protein
MAESDSKHEEKRPKNFSTQTVRVPREIEKSIGHRLVDTGESFQSFVMRLIDAELKRITSSDEAGIHISDTRTDIKTPPDESNVSKVVLQNKPGETEVLTPEEWRWVQRALHVLRGRVTEATKALDENMDAFCLLTDLKKGTTTSGERQQPATVSEETSDHIDSTLDALRANEAERGRVQQAAEHKRRAFEEAAAQPEKDAGGVRERRGKHPGRTSRGR